MRRKEREIKNKLQATYTNSYRVASLFKKAKELSEKEREREREM